LRNKFKPVKVGNLTLDGKRVYIQSMLNEKPNNIEGNIRQAVLLEEAGCEILRVAVPSLEDVRLIPAIKEKIKIPLVADIHFDYRIALECVEAGIDKIRINPGNIGSAENVKLVANACRNKKIPIRIGVNSGSLERVLLKKYGAPTAEALVESALRHAKLLENCDFDAIVMSLKASDVKTMVTANRLLAERCPYPLHLGVTEAGTEQTGMIKSAAGIGSLLLDGIGETIRISLAADPVKEIHAAQCLLKAIGLRGGVNVIACPTCGRANIDVIELAERIEEATADIGKSLTVAVMGCEVNGPGEAREADIGIAGGKHEAALFKKGEIIKKIPKENIYSALVDEINCL